MLERQRARAARARTEGKYKGRAPTARRQHNRVVALHADGLGATAVAAEIGISRASVYRVLADPTGGTIIAASARKSGALDAVFPCVKRELYAQGSPFSLGTPRIYSEYMTHTAKDA